MSNYDGFFEIKERQDGYYIEVTLPMAGGKNVEAAQIADQLQKQGIQYNLIKIVEALKNIEAQPAFKVADLSKNESALEIERKFVLILSDDRMKLMVKFYAVNDPAQAVVTPRELMEEALRLKVMVPIDEASLIEMLKDKKVNQSYVIASGTPAIEAVEANVQYEFKTEKDYRPEVDKDGNVNYHKLHVVASVRKGQRLAVLTPSKEGKSGNDLFGNEIKPKRIRTVKLKRGKNVLINDAATELYAEIDGLVKLEDEKVVVNGTFDVPGNVGSSTGDIDFPGSIIINGNVMSGYKVIAKGDVEVLGVVEGAIIEAGGNVLLHRGIQGNKSLIRAGGNVMARYIENAEVIAGGLVHSEAILHSNVSARGEIKVEGKKGMISGGTVRSGTEIIANILGSQMGTATNIEVGIDPILWEEYNELLKEIPKITQEAEKLEQVITLLNKKKEVEGELDEQKKAMYISATRNKIFLNNKISVSEKRLEELKEDVEKRNDGKIRVTNTVYPGTRITIGTSKYFVRDELKYVLLVKDGADVRLSSL